MHKVAKIFGIILLICAITIVSNATDVNELQEQKENLQNQINDSTSELQDVDNELTDNLQQIQKLDEKIENAENTLETLNKQISETETKIEEIQNDLDLVNQKYNTQKGLLDARLIAMYESDKTNYLDVVLGSKSISDFISTYYLISEITEYDMDLLETVEKEKNEIEEKSTQLNEQKDSLEQSRRTSSKTQITLSNTKLLRENYTSKLNTQEQELQAKIDEYNNQVKAIETEIKGLALVESFGEEYSGGPMAWPIPGHYTITSNYGMRVHPITGVYKLHTGVDISASIGTDFTAIANGIVVKAGYNTAYGNMVVIDHGGGVQTLYAHGSEILVEVGQEVSCGTPVLKVGSTGYSTGPHAHFEVRINGDPVDPLNYVSIPEN